jgi:hypothetical protein
MPLWSLFCSQSRIQNAWASLRLKGAATRTSLRTGSQHSLHTRQGCLRCPPHCYLQAHSRDQVSGPQQDSEDNKHRKEATTRPQSLSLRVLTRPKRIFNAHRRELPGTSFTRRHYSVDWNCGNVGSGVRPRDGWDGGRWIGKQVLRGRHKPGHPVFVAHTLQSAGRVR